MARILKSKKHKRRFKHRKATKVIGINTGPASTIQELPTLDIDPPQFQSNQQVSDAQSVNDTLDADWRSCNEMSSIFGNGSSLLFQPVKRNRERPNEIRIIEDSVMCHVPITCQEFQNPTPLSPKNRHQAASEDDDDDDDNPTSPISFFLDATPSSVVRDTVESSPYPSKQASVSTAELGKRLQILLDDDIYLDGSYDKGTSTDEDEFLSDYMERTSTDETTIEHLKAWLGQSRSIDEPYSDSILNKSPKDYPAINKKLRKLEKQSFKEREKIARQTASGTRALRKIDDKIQSFVRKDSQRKLNLHYMTDGLYSKVELLAASYGLTLSWENANSPEGKIPQLRKTSDDFIPLKIRPSRQKAEKSYTRGGETYQTVKSSKRSKNKTGRDFSEEHRLQAGTVVGSDAAPINKSNIGHRMLTMMGWKEGGALGTKEDGVRAPIEVVFRNKRTGLGSSS